jgi:hypothetical protein
MNIRMVQVNHEESSELIVTHQLVVRVDDVNLSGESINNTEHINSVIIKGKRCWSRSKGRGKSVFVDILLLVW